MIPPCWSAVFPLGMYVAATHDYATVAGLPFLEWIPRALFWVALLAWSVTFVGLWVHLLRASRAP
jgi:tellurite resistance protein TehA-like permease